MNISLEPMGVEQARLLGNWIGSREQLVQWSGPWLFTFPLDDVQLEDFFLTQQVSDQMQRRQFAAVDRETGQLVGQIGFSRIWTRTQAAHLGPVLVAPELRGRGIASQMVRELLRLGFAEMKLHRIELVVFDFNKPAIACYEKCGFVKEGVLREVVKVGTAYWSWVAMSVLEHEWRVEQ